MSAIAATSALNCTVLVLNRNYLAVRIVHARRAFSLLFRNIAEVVSIDQGNYNSYDFDQWCQVSRLKRNFEQDKHEWVAAVNFYIAVPKIVRLIGYDKMPRSQVKFNRRNIFARDGSRCQYCGKKFPTTELSLDHVIPKSAGGQTSWANIVCSCVKCNSKKGGRTPQQANMRLISKPEKPKKNPMLHLHIGTERYLTWKQFLDNAYWSVELK